MWLRLRQTYWAAGKREVHLHNWKSKYYISLSPMKKLNYFTTFAERQNFMLSLSKWKHNLQVTTKFIMRDIRDGKFKRVVYIDYGLQLEIQDSHKFKLKIGRLTLQSCFLEQASGERKKAAVCSRVKVAARTKTDIGQVMDYITHIHTKHSTTDICFCV